MVWIYGEANLNRDADMERLMNDMGVGPGYRGESRGSKTSGSWIRLRNL